MSPKGKNFMWKILGGVSTHLGVFGKRGVTFLPIGVDENVLQQETCNWTPNRYPRAKQIDLKTKKIFYEKPQGGGGKSAG